MAQTAVIGLPITSRSTRGFHFLRVSRYHAAPSGSIIAGDRSKIRGDNTQHPSQADYRHPGGRSPRSPVTIQPLRHVCATSATDIRLFLVSPSDPTIYPEEEQEKISVQLSASAVAFLSPFVFLRFEPAIISLNVDRWDQWLC